ncbi:hypothetical protein LC55x_2751 [Lysobacter capsici]|nr:hypothetical protein LC55x_2751 [Lysobacter capsici]
MKAAFAVTGDARLSPVDLGGCTVLAPSARGQGVQDVAAHDVVDPGRRQRPHNPRALRPA